MEAERAFAVDVGKIGDSMAVHSTEYMGHSLRLPREVWMLILGCVPFQLVMRFCTVSRDWLNLVYQSVVSFDGRHRFKCVSDEAIKRFPSLRTLDIPNSVSKLRILTDVGLRSLPSLTSLSIYDRSNSKLDRPISIEGITALTNLTSLNLHVDAKTMTNISALSNLASLTAIGCQLPDDCGLEKLPKLKILVLRDDIWRSDLKNISNSTLSQLTQLTALSLGNCVALTGEVVFPALTNLTELDLRGNCRIRDVVSELRYLRSLQVGLKCPVTNAGVSGLTNLTFLGLGSNVAISGDGIRHLDNLTSLELGDCSTVTDEDIVGLSNLRSIYLPFSRLITDASISQLTALTLLDIGYNKVITSAAVTRLTCLTFLDLRNNYVITDEISVLTANLKTLVLSGYECRITDSGLSQLTGLTSLTLRSKEDITDAGISGLTNLTFLEYELDSHLLSPITDCGVSGLVNLRELKLWRKSTSAITDECISKLPDLFASLAELIDARLFEIAIDLDVFRFNFLPSFSRCEIDV